MRLSSLPYFKFLIVGLFLAIIPLAGILTFAILPASPQPISPVPLKKQEDGSILPFATDSASSNLANLTLKPTITPPPSRPNVTGEVTIAVMGDSMVDTLGENIPALSQNLAQYYPNVKFNIINHGIGATNITYGLFRLTHDYVYKDKNRKAVLSLKPDLIIVESFAYNQPSASSNEQVKYLATLDQIVNTINSSKPDVKIAILATIAPDKDSFAANAPNIFWSPAQRINEAEAVRTYLKLALKFAKDRSLTVIDAYHPSLEISGDGNPIYINQDDNIHPSPEGINLVSEQIAKTIFSQAIVEKILAEK